MSLRIAFFGLPLAAVLLARDGHAIVYAGVCRRALGLRRLRTKVAPGRTHLRPDLSKPAVLAAIRDARPELVVSWFWTTKLPGAIRELAPSVGVHPSLLPRHRGPDPCFWAIDRGDAETGVTAHLLDDEYDTGPILGQLPFRIDPSWDGWRLARALDRPSLALLRDVANRVARGEPPRPVVQDEREATTAPEPTDEDLALRWSWSSEQIDRRVRAAAPWPGAWTEIGETIVTVVRVRPTRDFPRALESGEAAVRPDGVAVVRSGDTAVELLAGRDENDAPLDAAQLAEIVRRTAEQSGSKTS